MDEIHLDGIVVEACIGVYDWEKGLRQRLVIDLCLFTDTRQAAASDDLNFAVDYEKVVQALNFVVANRHYQLIETMAEHIADTLCAMNHVHGVRVSVSKPNAVPQAKNTRVVIQRDSAIKK